MHDPYDRIKSGILFKRTLLFVNRKHTARIQPPSHRKQREVNNANRNCSRGGRRRAQCLTGRPRRHGRSGEVDRRGVPAVHPLEGRSDAGDGVVRQGRRTLPGHGDQRVVGDDPHPRVRVEGAHQGVRGDHRDQGEPPAPRRGRESSRRCRRRCRTNRKPVRRLHQRLGPHRHALAPAARGDLTRLDGGGRQGRDPADPRRRRLHRQVVHDRSPTASSTSSPDQQFANLYWFRYDWFQRPS